MPRATQIFFIVLIAVLAIVAGCNTKTEVPGSDNYFFIEFDADGSSIKYEDGVDNYGNGPGINSYPSSASRLHSQFTTYVRNALHPGTEDKIWSSDKFYGEQLGWAHFELSSHKAVEETLFGGKTKGTFNYLVIDDSGVSLELRNGNFHARTIFRHS